MLVGTSANGGKCGSIIALGEKKRRVRNGAGGTADVGSAGESMDTSARGFRVCGAIRMFNDDGGSNQRPHEIDSVDL